MKNKSAGTNAPNSEQGVQDISVDEIFTKLEALNDQFKEEYQKTFDEIGVTAKDLHELFDDLEDLEESDRSEIMMEKEAFKKEMETIIGADEFKKIEEEYESLLKAKARKKISQGSRRQWINVK